MTSVVVSARGIVSKLNADVTECDLIYPYFCGQKKIDDSKDKINVPVFWYLGSGIVLL